MLQIPLSYVLPQMDPILNEQEVVPIIHALTSQPMAKGLSIREVPDIGLAISAVDRITCSPQIVQVRCTGGVLLELLFQAGDFLLVFQINDDDGTVPEYRLEGLRGPVGKYKQVWRRRKHNVDGPEVGPQILLPGNTQHDLPILLPPEDCNAPGLTADGSSAGHYEVSIGHDYYI